MTATAELNDHIEELKLSPPVPTRSWWDKVERFVAWVALAISVYAVVGLARQSNCINTNLGSRQAPSQQVRVKELAWLNTIVVAFDPTSGTAMQRGERLKSATVALRAAEQFAVDQAAAHPLGKC